MYALGAPQGLSTFQAVSTAVDLLRRFPANPTLVWHGALLLKPWNHMGHAGRGVLCQKAGDSVHCLLVKVGTCRNNRQTAYLSTQVFSKSYTEGDTGTTGETHERQNQGAPSAPREAVKTRIHPGAGRHGQVILFAEMANETLAGKISGSRLQRLATAAAARGLRDPRAWAALAARAIELNRATGCNSQHTAEPPKHIEYRSKNTAETSKRTAEIAVPASDFDEEIGTEAEDGAAGGSQHSAEGNEIEYTRGFRHFEGLKFLSSFLAAGYKDTELLLSFEPHFLRQLHAFDCRHLLQLLQICEQHNQRSRRLYAPLFRTLAAQGPSLLFQEITDIFCFFAANRVGSNSCCLALFSAAAAQVSNASLSDCIRLCGALHALGMAPELSLATDVPAGADRECTAAAPSVGWGSAEEAAATVLALVGQRVSFLSEAMPLQLLLDEVQILPGLEFSWRPYEELVEKALMKRLTELGSAEDVEQLANPFATLQFLRAHGWVQQAFLKAMIHWCAAAAYKPATRSQKRPTAEELVMLHDACRECGMGDDERLQKAILKFVSTKGGTARRERFVSPLEYQRNRRYFYLPDLRAGYHPVVN